MASFSYEQDPKADAEYLSVLQDGKAFNIQFSFHSISSKFTQPSTSRYMILLSLVIQPSDLLGYDTNMIIFISRQ